jgi:hypothetical protein
LYNDLRLFTTTNRRIILDVLFILYIFDDLWKCWIHALAILTIILSIKGSTTLHMIYLIIPTVSTYDLFSYLRYSECKNGYIVNYIEFALLLALIRHLKNKFVFLCRTLYCLLLIK